jgi:hypothetical protein
MDKNHIQESARQRAVTRMVFLRGAIPFASVERKREITAVLAREASRVQAIGKKPLIRNKGR